MRKLREVQETASSWAEGSRAATETPGNNSGVLLRRMSNSVLRAVTLSICLAQCAHATRRQGQEGKAPQPFHPRDDASEVEEPEEEEEEKVVEQEPLAPEDDERTRIQQKIAELRTTLEQEAPMISDLSMLQPMPSPEERSKRLGGGYSQLIDYMPFQVSMRALRGVLNNELRKEAVEDAIINVVLIHQGEMFYQDSRAYGGGKVVFRFDIEVTLKTGEVLHVPKDGRWRDGINIADYAILCAKIAREEHRLKRLE